MNTNETFNPSMSLRGWPINVAELGGVGGQKDLPTTVINDHQLTVGLLGPFGTEVAGARDCSVVIKTIMLLLLRTRGIYMMIGYTYCIEEATYRVCSK